MRRLCVMAFSGLALAGCLLAFAQSSASRAVATDQSTAEPLPREPPPALVLAPQDGSTGTTPAGLICIQNALGGVRAIAAVTSLRIISTTKVTVTNGSGPMASKREIGVQFPDRFKYVNVQTDMPAGSDPAVMVSGFNGNVPLSNLPAPPGQLGSLVPPTTRAVFVREILMRLPRELPGVRLSQRTTQDAGQERLAIDASGLPGLNVTLLADPRTCMPVAVQYGQATAFKGRVTNRVALSQYRRFGGLLFPTLLKTTRDGGPWADEYVSEIHVNAPFDAGYFRAGGT